MRRAVVAAALALCACGDDGGGAGSGASGGSGGSAGTSAGAGGGPNCIDPLPDECGLAFAPSYDAFYENLLRATCGASSTGGSCHGPDGGMAGLFLHDREMAYDYLLGDVDDRARVIPGDPECSELVRRIESTDPDVMMPPTGRLSDGQRCAIERWIAMGAKR
jgi:hypothetical protein